MDAAAVLEQLGFGEYEARAYVALLQHGAVTGYELAKVSGIPRPNIYGVLQKLEERAAVVRVDTPDAIRYAPVPVDELLERMGNRFQATIGTARGLLAALGGVVEPTAVWNVRDYPTVLEHARGMIDRAEAGLVVAVCPTEALALQDAIADAEARAVKLTTLCLAGCPEPCGGCRGDLYRYRTLPTPDRRWLVVVPDGVEVLAGEIHAPGEATAVRTRQPLLVELASWFIRHTIALAALAATLGDQLESSLGPQARATLTTVGPVGSSPDWLSYVRSLNDKSAP